MQRRFNFPFSSCSFLALLFLSTISLGALSSDIALRKTFIQAEKNVWQANSSKYKSLYNKLHFYPLQPYLDQKKLIHKMGLSKAKEIDTFLTKYNGTPLDWPLRKKWLNYLAKRKRKTLFIKYYVATGSAELACQFYNYNLALGAQPSVILPKVTKLWLVGKSQPKVCDPLFKAWELAGYRTDDVIWQRISLAAQGGKHTLIPYLTRLLPKSEQYLGTLWHKVRRDPAYISNLKRFAKKSTKEAEIISYGLKRLIWRDPNKALKIYKQAQLQFQLTKQQQADITLKFALALASKGHKNAQHWLHKVDDKVLTGDIIQWRIAQALRNQDWQAIKKELDLLPINKQKANQWTYWYGRSLLETGQADKGRIILKELAQKRHYYGFLAASYIDEPINLEDEPLKFTQAEKDKLLINPAAKRAFEFFHLSRFNQARKEWNYWLSKLNNREKLIAAKIANEIKWFDRAIFTLSSVGYLNDVDLRFPLAFNEEILHYSSTHNVNPAWAFAITRRESSFMSDANSTAGAKGLMQVMPNTAKQLRKRLTSKKYLLTAKNNINLGTKYLRQLLDKNKGNNVLATASYNAGPYRIKKWLKGRTALPADVWIETIPFKETRDYVKSVLAYQQIYQVKIGQQSSLFDDIIKMDIGD